MTMFSKQRRTLLLALASCPAAGMAATEVKQPQELAPGEHLLPATPSEMVAGPLKLWEPLAVRMEAEIHAELAAAQGGDAAWFRDRYLWLAQIAQLSARPGEVRAWQQRARRLQSDPVAKHLSGVVNELVADAVAAPRRNDAALRVAVRKRFAAMPWDVVGASVRSFRAQLAASTQAGLVEAYRKRADQQVSFSGLRVTLGLAMQILGGSLQHSQVLPRSAALVAGLDDVLALHP